MRAALLILLLSIIATLFATGQPSLPPRRPLIGPPELREDLLGRWNAKWRAEIQDTYKAIKQMLEITVFLGRPYADEAAVIRETRKYLKKMLKHILSVRPQGEDAPDAVSGVWPQEEDTSDFQRTGKVNHIPDDLVEKLLRGPVPLQDVSIHMYRMTTAVRQQTDSGDQNSNRNPSNHKLQMSEGAPFNQNSKQALGSAAARANKFIANVLNTVQHPPPLPNALGDLVNDAAAGRYPGKFAGFQNVGRGFAIP